MGDGEGRSLGDVGAKSVRLGIDVRGHAVDEAQSQGLIRLQAAGGEDHLLGGGGADGGGDVTQPVQRIGQPQPRRGQGEDGAGIGHPQVAGQRDGEATADAEALDAGDHRPCRAADRSEGLTVQSLVAGGGGGIVAGLVKLGNVGA